MGSLKLKWLLILLTSLTLYLDPVFSVNESQCHWPDGAYIDDPTMVPCNATADVSICCGDQDACTTNGWCLGSAGYVYRGGCTDQTWTSSVCQQQCKESNPTTSQNLYPCSEGVFSNLFCCGGSGDTSCCNTSFIVNTVVGFTGVAFLPAAEAEIDLGISSTGTVTVSTVTTTTTATLVASATSGSRPLGIAKGGVVGAAIGSAIVGGLLGLLAGFLMWRKARHSLGLLYQVRQGGDLHQGGGGDGQYQQQGSGVGGPYQQQVKAELPQSTAVMQELSGGNYRGG